MPQQPSISALQIKNRIIRTAATLIVDKWK